MHYCFEKEGMVFGCDHADCNRGNRIFGTKINGMQWCNIEKKHVYGCDHVECNKLR